MTILLPTSCEPGLFDPVDAHVRAGERLWAVGDVTGVWPPTYVAMYQGDIVAANIFSEPREGKCEAGPRVVFTGPQAAAVGVGEDRFRAMAPLSDLPKTATCARAVRRPGGR